MKKTVIALILFFALAQFSNAQDNIVISNAWVRGVPPGSSVSAVYMTIENKGGEDDRLTGMSSDVAESAELHISKVSEGGVSTMERIKTLNIPSGKTAELKPGGMHVMLIGLKESLAGKEYVTLNMNFEKSGVIKIEVPVKSAVDGGGMHHH